MAVAQSLLVVAIGDLADAVGASMWSRLSPGNPSLPVADIVLAEPDSGERGGREDIVLGVGLTSVRQAVALAHRAARVGAPALVLAGQFARDAQVIEAAVASGLMLLALRPGASWTHLICAVRSIVDEASPFSVPGDHARSAIVTGGAASDLFVLADAVAGILQAPVTIEDHRSRVLAYSSEHPMTDAARVSTIVGRRVPPAVVAHFQARGVFRRLANSAQPFLVPAGPGGIQPRFVIPIRAGEEWLGSIWALVNGPVDPEVVAQLAGVASTLALQLLRLRAQADLARRRATARLRELLEGTPGAAADLLLPPGPWRVVALTGAASDAGPDEQLELWTTTLRRHGWAEPSLTTLDRTVLAVVTTAAGPGSWDWLTKVVMAAHDAGSSICAAAGAPAAAVNDLPLSQRQALETLVAVDARPVATHEQSWAERTVRQATAGVDAEYLGGPAAQLAAHDREHGTHYVDTLRAVLRFPTDPSRAATSLHVHPNTLRHRMSKVFELVQIDLSDPLTRLALLLQVESLA